MPGVPAPGLLCTALCLLVIGLPADQAGGPGVARRFRDSGGVGPRHRRVAPTTALPALHLDREVRRGGSPAVHPGTGSAGSNHPTIPRAPHGWHWDWSRARGTGVQRYREFERLSSRAGKQRFERFFRGLLCMEARLAPHPFGAEHLGGPEVVGRKGHPPLSVLAHRALGPSRRSPRGQKPVPH